VSRPTSPQPVKLVASILTGEQELVKQVCTRLVEQYGPIDYTSAVLPFTFTDYYRQELGEKLFRHIISFGELVLPDILASVKLFTNELENQFLRNDGSRRINVDPGYIALCHLILATCKPFAHRPYLRDGVYADMTLLYRRKSFRPLEWTFPDYGSEALIAVLNTIRETYYTQLNKGQTTPHDAS